MGHYKCTYCMAEHSGPCSAAPPLFTNITKTYIKARSLTLAEELKLKHERHERQEKEKARLNNQVFMGQLFGIRYFNTVIPNGYVNHNSSGYLIGSWNGKWYSPRQTARCRGSGRRISTSSPHKNNKYGCSCGINVYSIEYLKKANKEWDTTKATSTWRPTGFTCAFTSIWGKIIEHEYGYRAQKAEIQLVYHHDKKELRNILSIPGFKKRGTQGTNNWLEFLTICLDAHKKAQESFTQIPPQETSNVNART